MLKEVFKGFFIIKLEKYEVHVRSRGNTLKTVGYFLNTDTNSRRVLIDDFPVLEKYKNHAEDLVKTYLKKQRKQNNL